MLWILISLFFCWMIFREFRVRIAAPKGFDRPDPTPISQSYLAVLLVLALAFAWPPFRIWRIERFLSAKASELADFRPANVHCNTIFDTFVDLHSEAAGYAFFETGSIVFQYPWCDRLMDYLDHPARASRKEIESLSLLVHESMHIRGEHNEALAECQAVQRYYRAAKLLGVPDRIAKRNALAYYQGSYLQMSGAMGIGSVYFSVQCAPGKEMDEQLSDSTWD